MKFLPNTSKEYPLRFFIYWLIIWVLLFLYSIVIMLPKISHNGYVVRKDVCLEEGTTGRFDEYTKCLEYGEPNYVPVGKELINNFKNYGFGSFIVVFFIGWILRNGQKIEERKNKKPLFDDLKKDEKKIDTYEFSRHDGEKVKITVGHSDTDKADIYWDDIVASKNNSYEDLCDENGDQWIDSNYHPEEALNFVNKVCPKCGDTVNRFYFYSNKKREFEYTDWMEVCFKCKKILYFDVDYKD